MLTSDGGTARLRPAAAAFLGASPNPNAYNYSFYSNSQPPPTQSSSPRELLQDLPIENLQQLHDPSFSEFAPHVHSIHAPELVLAEDASKLAHPQDSLEAAQQERQMRERCHRCVDEAGVVGEVGSMQLAPLTPTTSFERRPAVHGSDNQLAGTSPSSPACLGWRTWDDAYEGDLWSQQCRHHLRRSRAVLTCLGSLCWAMLLLQTTLFAGRPWMDVQGGVSLQSRRSPQGARPSPPDQALGKTPSTNATSLTSPDLRAVVLSAPSLVSTEQRQRAVVATFKWAWHGYKQFAWGSDELLPVSKQRKEWHPCCKLGLTIVDSLDTLLLMGLTEEYQAARDWVENHLNLDQDVAVNLFETTIRLLGGLLAAYHLSGGDALYLTRATDLGQRLLPAFDSPSGIPFSDVNLRTGHASSPDWTDASSLAEVTTLVLEFNYLAHLTGRHEFALPAQRVMDAVDALHKADGLAPIYISPKTGKFSGSRITLGARGDSYYEYLLKEWVQSGHTALRPLRMYQQSITGIQTKLLKRSKGSNLLYVAELEGSVHKPKMDHLVCFLPGVIALGAQHGAVSVDSEADAQPEHPFIARTKAELMQVAHELTATCWQMYRRTPTGLAAEITHFVDGPQTHEQVHEQAHDESAAGPGAESSSQWARVHQGDSMDHKKLRQVGSKAEDADMLVKVNDAHNLLRPETVESLLIMWRTTGDPIYRDWGWEIYVAFERHTRVSSGGYTSLKNVLEENPPYTNKDKQESFFMAETLKYLYLLFSDDPDLVPLDKYVFNTEAHPLPIIGAMPWHVREVAKLDADALGSSIENMAESITSVMG